MGHIMSNESQHKFWREWDGGEKAPYMGMVEVQFRYGEKEIAKATAFRWNHIGSCADIVAWRPVVVDSEKVETALDTQIGGEHYKKYAIQPVEFITNNELGFLEGCVIKRICRYENKNGLEDLKKAKHEIDLLIELKYGRQT